MSFSTTRLRIFSSSLTDYSIYISWFFRLCFLCFIIGYLLINYQFRPRIPAEYRHLLALRSLPIFSECRIPRPDPWDPMILPYYAKPEPLICKPAQKPIATFNNGILQFDKDLLKDMQCFLTPFWHNIDVSDFDVAYSYQTVFNFTKGGYSWPIQHEFFEVRCLSNDIFSKRDVFIKNFFQILPSNFTHEFIDVTQKFIETSNVERPSVIMLGIDSMSRQNWIRQLPKTYARMKMMGFIDMQGQVKIHDNTYGNLMAVLTGKRGVSTKEFNAEIDESLDISFDDIDFIWRNFSKNGYTTLFAEDRPDIGTFNYMKQLCGFKKIPVDHYMRPFWLASYWSITSRLSTTYCYDEKPWHRIMLDYLEEFMETYEEKRQFAFWWTQDMSHDYLNYIGKIDDDLEAFLKKNEKKFENTIVILLSDHGHRYDNILETVNGRLESHLPFLSIRLPSSVREQYPFLEKQLKENTNRLTTAFDLHETLNEFAFGTFTNPHRQPPSVYSGSRGYSLFSQIPKNRTCYEAGIPEDICPCFNEKKIELSEAKKAAEVLLARINDILMNAPELERNEHANNKPFVCSPMEIEEIQFASVRLPSGKVVVDPQVNSEVAIGIQIHYHIIFKAKPPSGAIIEGTAIRDFTNNDWYTTNEFERNNAYGNRSMCVNDVILKKLCHCLPSSS